VVALAIAFGAVEEAVIALAISLTPSDGTQCVFRGSPMPQNWGKLVKIGSKSMKTAPKTAEKRLRHFAPPIGHDQAHYPHAFDHRGPWYRQQSAILAMYGAARDGVLWARKRRFFLRPRWATSAESLQIRYRRVVGSTAYF
jgi:hypothetical protein